MKLKKLIFLVFSKMEYSQVVRHRFLIPTDKGSNPFTPEIIYVI